MPIYKNKYIVARKIHGSFFLIDISENYFGDRCILYEINEVGMFIWDHINGSNTIEKITLLLSQFIKEPIDYEYLLEDVTDFINELKLIKFIEVL